MKKLNRCPDFFAFILVSGLASSALADSAGCGLAPPVNPGETARQSFAHNGLARSYRLHLPSDYDQNTPTPVVLNFQDYFGSAIKHEINISHMSRTEDRDVHIVVYGQSTGCNIAGGFASAKVPSAWLIYRTGGTSWSPTQNSGRPTPLASPQEDSLPGPN